MFYKTIFFSKKLSLIDQIFFFAKTFSNFLQYDTRDCPEGVLNDSEVSSKPQRRGQGGSREREKMEV